MAVFTAQPGTVEQVQAFDTLRIIYGEACGDPTSQRIAHEGYLRIAQILFAQAGHQQGPRFGRGPKAMNEDQGSTSSACAVVMDRKAVNIANFFTHTPEEHADASRFCYCLAGASIEWHCQRHPSSRQRYKGWQGRKPGKRVLG